MKKQKVLPQTKLVGWRWRMLVACLRYLSLCRSLSLSPAFSRLMASCLRCYIYLYICMLGRVCVVYDVLSQFPSYLYRAETWVEKLTHLPTHKTFFFSHSCFLPTSSFVASSFAVSHFALLSIFDKRVFCFNAIYSYEWPKGLGTFKIKIYNEMEKSTERRSLVLQKKKKNRTSIQIDELKNVRMSPWIRTWCTEYTSHSTCIPPSTSFQTNEKKNNINSFTQLKLRR